MLEAPVVLVLDATKVTRTLAATVAGVRAIEPGARLAGVVLNRVGGPRHRAEARTAVEEEGGVPVLGAIPKLRDPELLPDRHLGLVPPEEHGRMAEVVDRLADVCREHLDLDRLLGVAGSAGSLSRPPAEERPERGGERPRIGVFRDSAFTFYYPENLEALERLGAEIVSISAFDDPEVPDVDLLYLGGGFPETQAEALSANRSLLFSVREACRRGLPVFAECGGLIYLARSVAFRGRRFELAGVLPADVEVCDRPQGHGYVEAVVDRANPFFAPGTVLRGHEFHYSRLRESPHPEETAFGLRKGTGCGEGRDGIVAGNVLASWTHLHAEGAPEWASALIARAEESRKTLCGSSR
jgi:cobyrinic acid a,c-diamide synthase